MFKTSSQVSQSTRKVDRQTVSGLFAYKKVAQSCDSALCPERRMNFTRAHSVPPWEEGHRDRGISIADLSDLKELSAGPNANVSFGDLGKAGEALLGDDHYSVAHKVTVSAFVPRLVTSRLAGEVTAAFTEAGNGDRKVFTSELEWKKTLYNTDVTLHCKNDRHHIQLHNSTLLPGTALIVRGGRAPDTSGRAGAFALMQAEVRRRLCTCKATLDVGDQNRFEVEATAGSQAAAIAAHASFCHVTKQLVWKKMYAQLATPLGSVFLALSDTQDACAQAVRNVCAHVHTTLGDKTQVAVGSDVHLNWTAAAAYQIDASTLIKAKVAGSRALLHGDRGEDGKVCVCISRDIGMDAKVQVVTEVNPLRLTSATAHRWGFQALLMS